MSPAFRSLLSIFSPKSARTDCGVTLGAFLGCDTTSSYSIEKLNRPPTGPRIACMGFQIPRECMDALERMNHESP